MLEGCGAPEHGIRNVTQARGPHLPLEVADPQDQLRDLARPALLLDAAELVRGHAVTAERKVLLRRSPEGDVFGDHLRLEALQQIERDVEEVAGAARRVEHLDGAELPVEGAYRPARPLRVAGRDQLPRLRPDQVPTLPQRLLDGWTHQPLDEAARSEVGPEPAALGRVERLFEQRTEDRRVDVRPVAPCRFQQPSELPAVEPDRSRLEEQPSSKATHLDSGKHGPPVAHRGPELCDAAEERRRIGNPESLEMAAEHALRQQSDVLREHREQAPLQEDGDTFGVLPSASEVAGELGDMGRDLAGDFQLVAARVEGVGVEEDRPEEVRVLVQVLEVEAARPDVGKRHVVTRPVEAGIEVEAESDVADDQEGGAVVQRARVAEGLA